MSEGWFILVLAVTAACREKRDAEKKAKIQRLESEWSETAAGPGAGSQGTSEHALKKMRGS